MKGRRAKAWRPFLFFGEGLDMLARHAGRLAGRVPFHNFPLLSIYFPRLLPRFLPQPGESGFSAATFHLLSTPASMRGSVYREMIPCEHELWSGTWEAGSAQASICRTDRTEEITTGDIEDAGKPEC
jgi:hypothetical protein